WRAFGYGFPPIDKRIAVLEESLTVIAKLLESGSSTFAGRFASTDGAVNVPAGIQKPRVPIVVGGNGPRKTWALAARYADELNIDAMPPNELEEALPLIRDRCSEAGRDRATLKLSVHIWGSKPPVGTPERLAFLSRFQTLPRDRVGRVALL